MQAKVHGGSPVEEVELRGWG